MRKIKFRAWSKNNYGSNKHEMIYYPELLHGGTVLVFENPPHERVDESDFNNDAILMQYVGLSDKNGKEIYEGDIVKYWGGEHPIIYYENGFYIKYSPKDYYSIQYESKKLEVIGNIYENPELITK